MKNAVSFADHEFQLPCRLHVPYLVYSFRVADHLLAQNRLAIWIFVVMTALAEDRKPGDGSPSKSGSGSDLHAGKRLGGLRRGNAFVQRGRRRSMVRTTRRGAGESGA